MQIIKKKVKELRFHPLWQKTFKGKPPQYNAIKTDMGIRGQQQIVEIAADDTIITGHLRVLICKELGIEEILCVVRTDLDTEKKQLQHMIKDNSLRRQLSAVEIAELSEILAKTGNDCPGRQRDRIAAEFGFSGRKLADIQRAVKEAKENNDTEALNKLSTSSNCASRIIEENKNEGRMALKIDYLKKKMGDPEQKQLDSYDKDPPAETSAFLADGNITVIPKNKQAEQLIRTNYDAEEIKVSIMDYLSSPGVTANHDMCRNLRKILGIVPKATVRLLKDNNICIESGDWFFRA